MATNNANNGPNVSFSACLETQDLDVTGAYPSYRLGQGNPLTITQNTYNCFNTNGTFTAPISGVYYFQAQITLQNFTSSMTGSRIQLSGSAPFSIFSEICNPYATGTNIYSFFISHMFNVNAGHTVTAWCTVVGGTQTVDTYVNNMACNFSGYRVF